MPKISDNSVPLNLGLQPLAPILETIRTVEVFSNRINELYLEPLRLFSESFAQLIGTPNKAFIQIIEAAVSFKPFVMELPKLNTFIAYPENVDVVEGEVEKTETETALLPAAIPLPTQRSKMGLRHISGGNFSYKRKALVGLSLNNREGKLLGMILENSDLFISDEAIDEKFYTEDTLGRSDLVKLLKKKFKLNELKVKLKKQGKGYILINIHPLYIN